MRTTAFPFGVRLIAHRGLHRQGGMGPVENSLPAFAAAIRQGFAIETDIRTALDGEPVVFHDAGLERLTGMPGLVAATAAAALRALTLAGTRATIPRLADLLDLTNGRVPLFLEIKSGWPSDRAFLERTAKLLRVYRGPVAVMSFDPQVIAAFRELVPSTIRGLGVTRWRDEAQARVSARSVSHALSQAVALAGPDFLAIDKKLPPAMFRNGSLARLPRAVWTIRSRPEARACLGRGDAIIFEGFNPGAGGNI